jgi:pantetheine-phosphate adenylyltransferase
MNPIAVYPGTFDPPSFGHLDIISRALPFFSILHIVVAENQSKRPLFSVQERVDMISKCTGNEKGLVVSSFDGLVVDYAKEVKANAIIRGLRAVSDFDYEFQLATLNRRLAPDIETIFFTTRGKYFYINSTMIKDVARHKGDISAFVPSYVELCLREKFKNG